MLVQSGLVRSKLHRVLVVENSVDLATSLVSKLSSEGYSAECVHTGAEALKAIRNECPDVVLLDVVLPDIGGFGVLEAMRTHGCQSPVIVLSGLTSEWDQNAAFRLGANRYVSKPFNVQRLLQLVAEITRTSPSGARFSKVEINDRAHAVRVNGVAEHFTPKEYEVLRRIVDAAGAVVSRRDLLEVVWGSTDSRYSKSMDSHIKQIRKALRKHDLDGSLETVHKVGYRWVSGA